MVTITVNNSYSNIKGLTASQEKKLRDLLSYTVGDHFSGFGVRKKSLLDKRGNFPTGLFNKVRWFCVKDPTLNNALVFKDTRSRPAPDEPIVYQQSQGRLPYQSQKDAMYAALANQRGIISMPTGAGKSFVIALIAARLGVRTLVVVPSLEIKKQLTADLGALMKSGKVVVENIDSARLQVPKDFDCLIIDEAHHSAAKTYQKLNKTTWTGIYYRFFMTATPFRNNTEENLLFESIAGSVIYELSYKDAVKEGYIVPVESYYIEMPKQTSDVYTWQQVYSELVVNNNVRNIHIAGLLLKLQLAEKSTLCLVKEVEHGKILSDLSGLPFVSGADEESRDYIRQFNNGTIKTLIATEGIMGEGVDSKPCEYVVIAGLGKAKSAFMQKVGRGVRRYLDKESCKVILIKDRSHRFCVKHFNIQAKILIEEYGSKPQKLEL